MYDPFREARITQVPPQVLYDPFREARITHVPLQVLYQEFSPSVSITPDAASFALGAVDPAVAIALIASMSFDTGDPVVFLSSTSVTPNAAEFALGAVDPTTYHGWIITPAFASFGLGALDPTVQGRFIRVTRHVMRIDQADWGDPGILRARAVRENPRLYAAVNPGVAGQGFPTDTIPAIGITGLFVLDSPLFRDIDDQMQPALYICGVPMTGDPAAWKGAVVFVSDDGQEWAELTMLDTPAVVGIAESALPNHEGSLWDRTSSVNLRMIGDGSLSSVTELDALNELNAFLWGKEVVIIQSVTQIGSNPNRYTVKNIIRGCQGTDWATGTHVAGEAVIKLELGAIQRVIAPLNTVRHYVAESIGGLAGPSPVLKVTNTGVSQKPYPVTLIRGTRDGSNNLTLTCERRSRIRGTWNLVTNPPLGETSELYHVEIWTTDFATLKRQLSPNPTTSSATYSAADQTTDGFTPGDPVGVRWYQISAAVGRGFVGQAVV
ncbi:MAG TPA: hypothetical protein VNL14_16615 [Candidatus Acidoferrales bacterium]|nr:hypothetical protein [Candidatus Acidoferrales bacterium]